MKPTPYPWTNDNGLVNGRESRARFKQFADKTPSLDLFDASEYPPELREEMMATAQLISAAPDLLIAAKEMIAAIAMRDLRSFIWGSERAELLSAAIAKAEGLQNDGETGYGTTSWTAVYGTTGGGNKE